MQSNGPERVTVVRLLKQGGFDVDRVDSLPMAKPAPAVTEAPAVDGLVREFLEDALPRARWNLLPFAFLYDLYRGWLKAEHSGTRTCGRKRFIESLERLAGDYGWSFPEKKCDGQYKKMWTADRMSGPEPMIVEYGLANWRNPGYQGSDPDLVARPKLAASYTGIYRTTD